MSSYLLLVDDDSSLTGELMQGLKREGFAVTHVSDGVAALRAARTLGPDLIILNLGLSDVAGLQVLTTLRAEGNPTRVLVLSGRHTEEERVFAFQAGADDFMSKPYSIAELLARIHARLRRPAAWVPDIENGTRSFGDVQINLASRTVLRCQQVVNLTPMEYRLLVALVDHANIVVTRDELLTRVWKYKQPVRTRTVDTHIARLRKKLEFDPAHPRHIITFNHVGYMLRRTPTRD